MEILKINPQNPDPKIIKQAAELIRSGGILTYPTDTCYGMGVDFNNKKALERLNQLKRRTPDKKFSVIVRNLEMIKRICEVDKEQEKILSKNLPGPFTFILKLRNKNRTLGIRIPDYLITQMLADELDAPYTTTSANISGQKECYDVECIVSKMKPDLILDTGKLPSNPPSTVVDLTGIYKVLRKCRGRGSNPQGIAPTGV